MLHLFVCLHAIGSASLNSHLCLLELVFPYLFLCVNALLVRRNISRPPAHTLHPLPAGTSRPTSSHSAHRCGAGIFVLLTVHGIRPCHYVCRSSSVILLRFFRYNGNLLHHLPLCVSAPSLYAHLSPADMLAAYSCLSRTF